MEALLVENVDRWVGWCGTPRTQPDVRGNETIAGQKAAITALLAGYYVMRAGSAYPCHAHYDSKIPGEMQSCSYSLVYVQERSISNKAQLSCNNCQSESGRCVHETGDAWPGGCFGSWNGSTIVADTLKSITSTPALSPGTNAGLSKLPFVSM